MKLKKIGTFKDFDDETIKSVYEGEEGIVEVTLLANKSNRNSDVFILPTHHYCNFGCKMCHLTKEGIKKPMNPISAEEILEGIIKTAYDPREKRRTTNTRAWLSFMGVGEPLLNQTLLREIFEREEELKRKGQYDEVTYAIATMMPNRGLERLATFANETNFPLKVHFSMHSPFSKERSDLLPRAKTTIKEALELLVNYKRTIEQNPQIRRNLESFHPKDASPIEIHYTLIEGQNDSKRHLEKTKEILRKYKIPFKILRFNPIREMRRSQKEQYWIEELQRTVPELTIRFYDPPGHKVGSSCGEFTKHYYLSKQSTKEEKAEFEQWKKAHEIEKEPTIK